MRPRHRDLPGDDRSAADPAVSRLPDALVSEVAVIVRYGRIYAIANVVNRAGALLLIPLFTHVLTPGEFGIYALIQSVSDLFAILFGLGFTGAMTRYYLEYHDDPVARAQVVSTSLLTIVTIAIAVVAFSYPLATAVTAAMDVSRENRDLFVLAFGALATIVLYEFACGYAVARKQVWTFFGLSVGKAVLLLGFNLLLVLHLHLGVAGILWSSIACFGIMGIANAAVVLRETGVHFSRSHFDHLLRFALPLVPSAVANAGLGVAERYFLNSLSGAASVGVYSLAQRLAALLQQFVAAPFSQIFFVRRVETLVQGGDDDAHSRVLLLFLMVMSLSALGLSLFAPEMLAVIATDSYHDAIALVPLLALCFVLASLNLNFEIGLYYTRATWAIPLVGILSLAVCIPADYYLVARFGAMGAAMALVLVNVARIAATLWFNARYGTRRITLDWTRTVALLTLSTAAGVVVTTRFVLAPTLMTFSVKVLLFLLITAGAFVSPLLDTRSRHDVLALLARFRRGAGSG
ncbi:MAG: oligosaccharide flippase family protein [Betaproteobacteria bacterium]|nr:oligosaccharide flippase family protein [Betaproteobacteria bacterium]